MPKTAVTIRCAYEPCGIEFEPKKRSQRFHHPSCKDAFWNAHKRAAVPPQVVIAKLRREIDRSHQRWTQALAEIEGRLSENAA